MSTRKYAIQYDYYILFAYILLMLIGLYTQLNISSVRSSMTFFYKQVMWFFISLFAVWFAFKKVNFDTLRKLIPIFLILTIALLILVLWIGTEVNGAIRSISITIPVINLTFNIQPSLIARVFLIIYFAHIISKKEKFIERSTPIGFVKYLHPLITIPIAIFILILLENHFSPLIISGMTLLSLLFLSKIKLTTISLIISILLICAFLVIIFGPKFRGDRIAIYEKYSLFHKILGIESDYRGENDYQIKESLISLSSGQIFGTTPRRGTGKHYFLPEAKTDYVFSIIGEEFGFIGASIVMLLYFFLFYRSLLSSHLSKSLFMKLVGYGIAMNIFYNAMVNIGVAISSIPSTGVTLPFISYGGTSLLVNSFSIGLLLNISENQQRT
ncbi:MAG: FtsW/RodA/SpoVE family cell cycle protein [Candidatus Cloacimonetes bacterium]|nr:FtsW/RodA/SpoVE family cell cycle protein [Candidatus Cloacimonadota bacterium]